MELRVKEWTRHPESSAWRRFWLVVILVGVIPLLALVPLVVAVLVVLPPEQYHPAVLDYEQRSIAAKQFYRQMMDFDDLAQSNVPFAFTFTAEQINRYLASVDEIAALLPEGQAGRVQEMMVAAGLRDPAIAIDRGRLILMVRLTKLGLIASAELVPVMDAQNRLVVRLGALRVGRLRVPHAAIYKPIRQTRDRLLQVRAAQRNETDVPGGLAGADLGDVATNYAMRLIVGALDGRPIDPEGKYRHRRLRLTGIDITRGQITVHVAPVPRPTPQSAASQTSTQSSPGTKVSE
jgi:hypothetical protein